jgi:hypothetical protein
VGDVVAAKGDPTLGDLGLVVLEQAGDGPQQRGLAGTVAPEEGHDLTLRHVERQPPQAEDHVVVEDLEVVDGQDRRRGRRHFSGADGGFPLMVTVAGSRARHHR